jgi:hypothetical protein
MVKLEPKNLTSSSVKQLTDTHKLNQKLTVLPNQRVLLMYIRKYVHI